tara:strand:+ start:1349 stop:2668 length:1320 start_codon:yes stop_codon:yes gene_type:complete
MRLFYFFILVFFVQHCSFDNKTNIWKNENKIFQNENKIFKDFETVSSNEKQFNKTIPIKNYKFKLIKPKKNYNWSDIYYNKTNNYINFHYNNENKFIFNSKKLTRNSTNKLSLFSQDHYILSDDKGYLIVFSVTENQVIRKFNFYKKKFKKIKKKLNYIIDNNIIYVSDNIGYVYAYDYMVDKILWAKNYKIPFSSNLKISKNKLTLADQNNNLYFLDKKDGNILKLIPTEEVTVKNLFINNLSQNKNSLFFLNTYGSLYSVDLLTMKINWFRNLNRSLNLNPSNLFSGNIIINNDDKIVISSNDSTYILDTYTGSILFKENFSSNIKPIIHKNYLFLITKNNYLISLDLSTGNFIYSYDLNKKFSDFFNKKKNIKINDMMLINNKIYVFLREPLLAKININGNIENINKLPVKIKSSPMIIDSSILYLNLKNKITIIN